MPKPALVKVIEEIKPIPLVVFSGGLDSTYMLYLALLKSDVDCVYVVGNQGEKKVYHELKARKKLIPLIERITGHRVRFDTELYIQTPVNMSANVKYQQPLQWLHALTQIVTPVRHSEVLMGYVEGDGMIRHLDNLTQAWKSIGQFALFESVPLRFPLVDTDTHFPKYVILDKLPAILYPHVWYCERPKHTRSKPCGKCSPCLTHIGAKVLFKLHYPNAVDYDEAIAKHIAHYKSLTPAQRTTLYRGHVR